MATLLFIHGASCDRRVWTFGFMQFFQQRNLHCHAMDLPGHGALRTHNALDPLDMNAYVEAVARAVRKLPAPVVLIGHSMGGYVAQKYLLNGGAAAALVLLASAPPWGVAGELLNFTVRHPVLALRLDLSGGRGQRDARLRRVRGMLLGDNTPDEMVAAIADQLQPEPLLAMRQLTFDKLPNAPLGVPVMVEIGALDRLISERASRAMARRYGTEARVQPDMAHMLQVEPGWERVANEVLHFIVNELGIENTLGAA